MTDKTYREQLDDGFKDEISRFGPLLEKAETADRLVNVMAVSFSLNAANDMARMIRQREKSEADKSSEDANLALSAAVRRMNGVFDDLLSAGSTNYEGMRAMVDATLEKLASPSFEELRIVSVTGDNTILDETTRGFRVIREFLNEKASMD